MNQLLSSFALTADAVWPAGYPTLLPHGFHHGELDTPAVPKQTLPSYFCFCHNKNNN